MDASLEIGAKKVYSQASIKAWVLIKARANNA